MSPESNDYRLYLEEKFGALNTHINAQFIDTHSRLDEIKEQTEKTNGRVTELELQAILHPVNCPVNEKIKSLETSLQDTLFFTRHPKLGIGIVAAFVIMFLASCVIYYETFTTSTKTIKENTEILNKVDSLNNE